MDVATGHDGQCPITGNVGRGPLILAVCPISHPKAYYGPVSCVGQAVLLGLCLPREARWTSWRSPRAWLASCKGHQVPTGIQPESCRPPGQAWGYD